MEGGVHKADASAFRQCISLAWENPYVLRLAFSAGIGGLLFGYDTGAHIHLYLLFYIQVSKITSLKSEHMRNCILRFNLDSLVICGN